MDIEWILTGDVFVVRQGLDAYGVSDLRVPERSCVISFTATDDRMRFNGEDIETEDFMAYVGMLDAVDETPNAAAWFIGEAEMFVA